MTKNINGFVDGQQLSIIAECVAADSMRFLTAKFDLSSEWLEYEDVYAHFLQGDESYWIKLTDGEIRAEDHLDLGAGCWQVYLHGNVSENGEVVSRITTNIAFLTVERTGSLAGEPFPHMNPSDIEDLIAKKHWHENKTTLDKFSESEGVPTFNGEEISGASTWDEIEDKPTTLAGYGIDEEVDEVISDYTYSKEESSAEIKKAIELVELCRTGWQESLYTPAEIKSTLKGKHLMWNGNPVIATSFVIVPGIGECAYVLIAVVVADDETTRNAHLTIGGVKVFPNKSASNLTMTKVLSDENFTAEFKDLLTNLGAEDVAYDDSETYSDGTVGKEITSLKSDIIEKLSDAPTDGKQYARQNGAWVEVEGGGGGVPLDEDSTVDFALGYDEGGLYIVTEDDDDE